MDEDYRLRFIAGIIPVEEEEDAEDRLQDLLLLMDEGV